MVIDKFYNLLMCGFKNKCMILSVKFVVMNDDLACGFALMNTGFKFPLVFNVKSF